MQLLALLLSCLDLIHDNMVIATLLLHYPGKHQDHIDGAVREAQRRIYEDSSTRGGYDTDWMSWTVKESCHLRLHHLPCCKELCKSTVTSIRASDINRLLSVSGTVIRTGVVKLLHSRREYMCAKCRHRFYVEVDIEQRHAMPLPDECPSEGLAAKHCNGTKFEQVSGSELRHRPFILICILVRIPTLVLTLSPNAPPPRAGARIGSLPRLPGGADPGAGAPADSGLHPAVDHPQ